MRLESMNRTKRLLAVLAICAPVAVVAQGRDRDRIQDRAQDQTVLQDRAADRAADRTADRDRTTGQDRIQGRDQDRTADQDRDRTRDQDRDRDPLYLRDRQQLRDRDIYGAELMTRKELREYRNQLATKNTVREWAQFLAQHQEQMTARARQRGVQLPAPFYAQELMTHQEREQLQQRLQSAASDQERARIQEEHREQMQERAREYGIPLNPPG